MTRLPIIAVFINRVTKSLATSKDKKGVKFSSPLGKETSLQVVPNPPMRCPQQGIHSTSLKTLRIVR